MLTCLQSLIFKLKQRHPTSPRHPPPSTSGTPRGKIKIKTTLFLYFLFKMFLLISNLRVRNECFFSFLTFGLEYDVRGTSPLWWECMAFVERRPSSANLGGAYDVRRTSPPKVVRVRRFWLDSGFLATSGHELTQNRARTEANTSVQGNLEVMGGEHS